MYEGKTVMTVLNGTSEPAAMDVQRYAELFEEGASARDITTGKVYTLSGNIEMSPRQTMILEIIK